VFAKELVIVAPQGRKVISSIPNSFPQPAGAMFVILKITVPLEAQ
jgi:hypothetical protein